jgi:sugar lactone lactonase YvrE
MNKVLFSFILLTNTVCCLAQSNSPQFYFNAAREAQQAGDNKKFYEMIMEAYKLRPFHQGILYQAGVAAALNNKTDESIGYLTEATRINADFDLNIPELKSLEGATQFKKLKQAQAESKIPVIHSDTAFLVKDKTLHAECIAKGESKDIFYFGSIHKRKIIRTDARGNITNFTEEGQDGLTSVFGIKVNPTKKLLWACSSPMPEMKFSDSTETSSVFKYDVNTRKLIAKYSPKEKKEYIFGDLTLDPTGKPFISDSKNNIIFTVNEEKGELQEFFTSDEFYNLQGLTFSTDGKYLFIADYIKGLFRLDTKDKQLVLIKSDLPIALKSVDGLSYYNNSLITIQNLIQPMRVTQLLLNNTQDAYTGYKIIDRAHPAFNEPTIGCVIENTFFYVANSQWSGYDDKRKIKPAEQLQDVVVLKSDLKKIK